MLESNSADSSRFSANNTLGGTPYNGLYVGALPERGTFYRLQVHERVGILLAYVYDRVGKSIISALKGVLYVSGRYTN